MTQRQDRVGSALRDALAALLARGAVKDPGLDGVGLISVTEVRVSPDLRHARVYVSLYGEEQSRKQALTALRRAAGFLRRELGHAVSMRVTPELDFRLDESLEQGARIEGILRELKES